MSITYRIDVKYGCDNDIDVQFLSPSIKHRNYWLRTVTCANTHAVKTCSPKDNYLRPFFFLSTSFYEFMRPVPSPSYESLLVFSSRATHINTVLLRLWPKSRPSLSYVARTKNYYVFVIISLFNILL